MSISNDRQLKIEEDETSGLPIHQDAPVLGSKYNQTQDDDFDEIKDKQAEGGDGQTGHLLIASENAEFDADYHVKTMTLNELLLLQVDQVVILLTDDQITPFLALTDSTQCDVALAESIKPVSGKFKFNTRELKLVAQTNLPLKNIKANGSDIKGLRDIAETPIDGLPNVTATDVEDALEKIRVVGSAPRKLWEK
jgi:hypothetical protein